jgi:dTDP-glucose 4,6-dehydratase
LIPLVINNIINKKDLPVYGDGTNVRDWLWVEDHAEAIDTIFHKGKNGDTYNIGGENELQNIQLVRMLCDIVDESLGRPAGEAQKRIRFVTDRKGHDHRYAIDAAKIMNELKWKPTIQPKEGLKRTVDWYLENQDWLKNITSGDYKQYYEKFYNFVSS